VAFAAALALVVATMFTPQDATARPHHPTTISSVTKKLNQLAHRADALTEQYNATRLQMLHEQHAFAAARRAQASASAAYQLARAQFAAFTQAQYEAGGFGSVGALLSSSDPSAYLDNVSSEQLVAERRAAIVGNVAAARAGALRAQIIADRLLAQARHAGAQLRDRRAAVAEQTLKYETVLSALTLPQQQAYLAWGTPSAAEIRAALDTPAASPAAAKAVKFAVNQIGKPYVWAATGPSAYDCSGLTMAAWASAGVTIPRDTYEQWAALPHISSSSIQPGDLLYYDGIGHVAMYVGNGYIIDAPQPGMNVERIPMDTSWYVDNFDGAARP